MSNIKSFNEFFFIKPERPLIDDEQQESPKCKLCNCETCPDSECEECCVNKTKTYGSIRRTNPTPVRRKVVGDEVVESNSMQRKLQRKRKLIEKAISKKGN